MHRSGFVNIIGRPNVGKSTLMNRLMGEQMSIITHKPQTTRHRILGLYNEDDMQIVFSDTPGLIEEPAYAMQHALNRFALSAFEDADLLLLLTDPEDPMNENPSLEKKLNEHESPRALVINKIDDCSAEKKDEILQWWTSRIEFEKTAAISALHGAGVDELMSWIRENLPEGPVYFPKDQLSDRNERFFASEIIREKILVLYHQEIPYSTEVGVTRFKESEDIIHIHATIYVNRKTHKPIIIGKGGQAIKKLGIEARKDLEKFFRKKIYLELHVKIKEGWRESDDMLRRFGY